MDTWKSDKPKSEKNSDPNNPNNLTPEQMIKILELMARSSGEEPTPELRDELYKILPPKMAENIVMDRIREWSIKAALIVTSEGNSFEEAVAAATKLCHDTLQEALDGEEGASPNQVQEAIILKVAEKIRERRGF